MALLDDLPLLTQTPEVLARRAAVANAVGPGATVGAALRNTIVPLGQAVSTANDIASAPLRYAAGQAGDFGHALFDLPTPTRDPAAQTPATAPVVAAPDVGPKFDLPSLVARRDARAAQARAAQAPLADPTAPPAAFLQTPARAAAPPVDNSAELASAQQALDAHPVVGVASGPLQPGPDGQFYNHKVTYRDGTARYFAGNTLPDDAHQFSALSARADALAPQAPVVGAAYGSSPALQALPALGGAPDYLHAITTKTESGNNRNAVSPAGAKSEMQVLDSTNRDPGYGVRPATDNSLEERARVGHDYLNALHARYQGDPAKMWTAYHMGPAAFESGQAPGPATQAYVAKNLAALDAAQRGGSAPAAALSPGAARGLVNPAAAVTTGYDQQLNYARALSSIISNHINAQVAASPNQAGLIRAAGAHALSSLAGQNNFGAIQVQGADALNNTLAGMQTPVETANIIAESQMAQREMTPTNVGSTTQLVNGLPVTTTNTALISRRGAVTPMAPAAIEGRQPARPDGVYVDKNGKRATIVNGKVVSDK